MYRGIFDPLNQPDAKQFGKMSSLTVEDARPDHFSNAGCTLVLSEATRSRNVVIFANDNADMTERAETTTMISERIIALACPELRAWTIDRIYSDPAAALETLAPLLDRIQSGPDRAAAQFAYGTALAVVGELQRAEETLVAALDYYRAHDNDLLAAHVLLRENLVWHQRGDAEGALTQLALVVETARKHGDSWLEAAALSDTALVQMRIGSIADGLANLFASLEIANNGTDATMRAVIRMNLGFALFELHDYNAAVTVIEEGLADPPGTRELPFLFEGHALLGACLEQLGQHERALECVRIARQLAAELVHPFVHAESAYDEGRLFYRLGQFDEARGAFQRSIDGYATLESPTRDAGLVVSTWWLELIDGRFTQETLDRLILAAQTTPTAYSRTFDLHDAIAQSAEALGNADLAITHLRESRRLAEAYWRELGDRQTRVAHRRFELETAQQAAEQERALRQQLAMALSEAEELNRSNQALLKQLHAQSARLERQAIEDPLTRIGNRRHFIRQLQLETARCRENDHPVTIAFADIDDFKEVNDVYSHRAGDSVLHDVARLMAANIREIDTVARYGGEEFAFILPEASEAVATQQLEQVRSAVERNPWRIDGRDLRVTISIGVVRLDPAATMDEMVTRADELLYLAKRSGKNQIQFRDFTATNDAATA